MTYSRGFAKPKSIIVSNPKINTGLVNLRDEDLRSNNVSSQPNLEKLFDEYDRIVTVIKNNGIEILDIYDILDDKYTDIISGNPNSIFVRDPVITLPWAPKMCILANMTLTGRGREPEAFMGLMKNIGITTQVQLPKDLMLEGGDILVIYKDQKRTLYAGIGSRTSEEAVTWLANKLINDGYIDEVVGLMHDLDFLHLDTCLAVLNNDTIVCTARAFTHGFVIDRNLNKSKIDAMNYLKREYKTIVYLGKNNSINREECNMLCVGGNRYLSNKIYEQESQKRISQSNIELIELQLTELPKLNGGLHCLTQPIY